ncbi:MAG: FAD-dependent oxidoreductase [Pseudomonadota bacterium]
MQRRDFLAATVAAPAITALPQRAHATAPLDAPYPPVLSAPSREIRTVVGHRPYRRSGFVLKREQVGRRTLVHNYGHGGCGVTLSWGCADLAVELAADARQRRAAVIGAGAIGLTTAHRLLRAGYDVTVYAEALPPHTTSNIAAAFWQPTGLFSQSAVDEDFLRQFRRAARLSQRAFQHLAQDPAYGVFWFRFFRPFDEPRAGAPRPVFEGEDLYPGRRTVKGEDAPFGFGEAEQFNSMMIDPDRFLRALMRDIKVVGGKIVRRRFESADDIFSLKERLIFNCTGLGAGALFDDTELTPVRGQLTMLLPQPEIDYGYVYQSPDGLLYMFPRRGAIVLGGTYEHGVSSTAISEEDRLRMFTGHAALAERISGG